MNRAAFHQLVFIHLRQFFPEVPDWDSAIRFLRLQGESMDAFDQLGNYTPLYHAVVNEAFKRYGDLSLNTYLVESVTLPAHQTDLWIGEPAPGTNTPFTHVYDPETVTYDPDGARTPLIKFEMNHAPLPTGVGAAPIGYLLLGSLVRLVPACDRPVTISLEGYGYPYFHAVDNDPNHDLLLGVRAGTEDTLARYVVSRLIDPINYDLGNAMRMECEARWQMERQRNSWNRIKRSGRRHPRVTGRVRRTAIGGWFE